MSNRKIKLGDYCDIIKGGIGIQKAIPGEFPLVVTAEKRLSHNEYHFDNTAVIIPLVSSTGHGHASLNRIHYQEGKFALGTILCAVIIKDETILNPRYLYLYLSYFKDHLLVPLMKGAANVTLSIKRIKTVEIPLPNMKRQLEIIELEKNSHLADKLNTEIQTQKHLLTQLKQSILQEAIQGKLTADWRDQNPNTEPASELLKRIIAEKNQLIKDEKIKKEKALPPISEEEIPFELPEGWVWCKIDSLVYSIKDDIRTGPFGSALQKSEHKESGVPVLGIESIGKQGVFTGVNKIYVSDKKAQSLKSFEVKGLDIIISRSGTIGELCLLPKSIGKALISTNLMKISLNHKVINPLFFCHLFEGSINIIEQMKNLCKGSTRLFVTQKILKNLFFQLPPLEEQKAIVEKVESLMRKCRDLEQEIKTSEANAQMLMQAVLKEAFEGEREVVEV